MELLKDKKKEGKLQEDNILMVDSLKSQMDVNFLMEKNLKIDLKMIK